MPKIKFPEFSEFSGSLIKRKSPIKQKKKARLTSILERSCFVSLDSI
jgi:hypothetical protein